MCTGVSKPTRRASRACGARLVPGRRQISALANVEEKWPCRRLCRSSGPSAFASGRLAVFKNPPGQDPD